MIERVRTYEIRLAQLAVWRKLGTVGVITSRGGNLEALVLPLPRKLKRDDAEVKQLTERLAASLAELLTDCE